MEQDVELESFIQKQTNPQNEIERDTLIYPPRRPMPDMARGNAASPTKRRFLFIQRAQKFSTSFKTASSVFRSLESRAASRAFTV